MKNNKEIGNERIEGRMEVESMTSRDVTSQYDNKITLIDQND